MRRVAFVGALPPPLHGFSSVCERMLQRLSAISTVEIFDRTPRGPHVLQRAFGQLAPLLRFLASGLRDRDVSVYLALSGGFGQLFDCMYALFGNMLRIPMFVHHHSFAYLNSPSLLSRTFFALTRKHVHLVLSAGMGERVAQTYSVPRESLRVISNAAFFDFEGARRDASTDGNSPLRLGYLANITLEKGIREFFQVLDLLRAKNIPHRGVIAGPVDPSAAADFARLLSASVDVEYVGPVFGAAKQAFYGDLDLFLFPSKYINEAEPLVILEALQSGVYVIGSDRGAIAEMIANGAGRTFPEASFVDLAVNEIRTIDTERLTLHKGQRLALEQSRRLKAAAHKELEAVLGAITRSS